MKVGWLIAPDAISGTKITSDSLLASKPEDVEIVSIDPEKPETADIFVVHTPVLPKNLPVFPKLNAAAGKILKKRPVVVYAHSWDVTLIGADIVVYQSPAHLAHKTLPSKPFVFPPPVLPSAYEKSDVEREDKGLWVGNFGEPTNGADIAIRKAESSKRETHFYGWGAPDGQNSNYCQFFNPVPYEEMNKVYQSHQILTLYPRAKSPFSRSVAEALLNGCEVEAWGHLGFNSFDSVDDALEACKTSGARFWEMVKEEA